VDFERELVAAREAVTAAGEIIARYSKGRRESWDKSEDNPVTQADLEANAAILRVLGRAFPRDVILSEETLDPEIRLSAERVWIVDPLDGTKEFIQGIPEYAVSVALSVQGEPVVGVVHQPLTGECVWGAQGRGAYLGEERLSVSSARSLAAAEMLSSRTEMSRGQVDRYADWFRAVKPVGSVALKLAFIAAGRGDIWVSLAPKSEWDVCGGDLLVREAGGVYVDFDGAPRTYNQAKTLIDCGMAAGAPELVELFSRRERERQG
jgi:myo-inositol-1(or 4)-monophosphatase